MKITTNKRVQLYLNYSEKKTSKHRKIQRMKQLEEKLGSENIYLDELFGKKSMRVLDEIVYLTTIAGIIKIGADKLSELSSTSVRTVYSAVKVIKNNPLGIFVGYLKNTHKYVFVDLQHADAKEMLVDLFGMTKTEIAELFAVHFAVCQTSEKSNTPMVIVDNFESNSISKNNKILINKETSATESSNKSQSNNGLYTKLKTLYIARRGQLDNWRTIARVIYSKIKKLKLEMNSNLTNVQIESIMYRSLDALLNMRSVKNELAMLNAIINNKVKDLVTPTIASTQKKINNLRCEQVPDWFDTRNDNTTNAEMDSGIDFEAEKLRILSKLGY